MSMLSIEKNFVFSNHEAPVYALEPFYDEGFFSSGGDKIISLRGLLKDSENKGIVNTGTTIYSLKFLPEKNILLAGVSGGGMHVVDLNEKKEIHFFLFHQKGIYSIQYSLANDLILTTGGDGKIAFWSAKDFSFIKSLSLCSEKIRSVAFNKAENIAAVGCGDGTIRIIHLEKLEQIHSFIAHASSVNAVSFHPEQDVILSAGRDAHLNFWTSNDFKLIKSIPAHNYAIYSIEFSPDKSFFATASRDRTVKIWESADLNFVYRIDAEKNEGHKHSVNKITWMKDNLLSASDDRSIISWKIEKTS